MQKNNNSIVLSSRIRLARNINSEVFPHKLSVENGYRVFCKIANAVEGLFMQKVYKLSELQENDFLIMQEKHLISPKLIKHSEISGVILSADESVSIMINEEDHVREQCILSGFALEDAYKKLNEIDVALDKKLNFSFDNALGFLTSCISNVGTGLRASIMMFLPALSISGKIDALKESLNQKGIVLRGAKGEESEEEGYLYQLSNMYTLGRSESEIIFLVSDAARRVVEMEKAERKIFASENNIALKDMIFRAFAILTGAYTLSINEFNQMLAQVKLGAILGLMKFKDDSIFEKLSLACQSASLAKIAGHDLIGQNENIFRADYVAQILKQNKI